MRTLKASGVLVLMVVGCRGMGGMEEEATSNEGVVKSYSVTARKALELAKEILKEHGADEFREAEGYVIGSFYVNFVTPGSYLGVYPKEVGGSCEVRVIARRKSSMSVFTGMTEDTFHRYFSAKLEKLVQK